MTLSCPLYLVLFGASPQNEITAADKQPLRTLTHCYHSYSVSNQTQIYQFPRRSTSRISSEINKLLFECAWSIFKCTAGLTEDLRWLCPQPPSLLFNNLAKNHSLFISVTSYAFLWVTDGLVTIVVTWLSQVSCIDLLSYSIRQRCHTYTLIDYYCPMEQCKRSASLNSAAFNGMISYKHNKPFM